MGVQCAIHENVQIVWQTVLCCYATRRTHTRNVQKTLNYAPATAASATAALATASASFAGVVRRLARTAATTSAGATDCGPADDIFAPWRALFGSGTLPVAHHLHHQVGVHCGGQKGLARHRICLVSCEPVLDGSSLVGLATDRLNRIDKQRQRSRAAELVGCLFKGKLGVRVGVHRSAGGGALEDWCPPSYRLSNAS